MEKNQISKKNLTKIYSWGLKLSELSSKKPETEGAVTC